MFPGVVQIIKLMSLTQQSLTEMATSIHVKDVLSFSFNTQFLHHNFSILKQCLIRLQDIEMNMGHQRDSLQGYSRRLGEVQEGLILSKKNHEVNAQKINDLQTNVGDEFMKRMYAIEEKTKNMFGFDDTVNRLQALDLFLTVKSFKENEDKTQKQIDEVKKIKNQFQRYLPNTRFDQFKEREAAIHAEHQRKQTDLQNQIKRLEAEIIKANLALSATNSQSQQNSKMLKQINFPEMLQKNRKFREDVDQKMGDLILKMKKKVGTNELVALEQTIIDKLDKFLSDNQKSKAEKNQTKDALVFLQKRIYDIESFFAEKANQDDHKDALFSVKRVHCASCTKDLGKFQGKLGQFKPWSIFPCKELDPEKTGGFGYMSYLDKVQVKKGSTLDDQAFDRLNKTAQEKEREDSPKRGFSTARPSNLISNYGSEQKGVASLKDVYFRELKTQKGDRNAKFFRIKKQGIKPVEEFEKPKQ